LRESLCQHDDKAKAQLKQIQDVHDAALTDSKHHVGALSAALAALQEAALTTRDKIGELTTAVDAAEEKERAATSKAITTVRELEQVKAEAQEQIAASTLLVPELQAQLEDAQAETRTAQRKNGDIIKSLQRELQRESQLRSKLELAVAKSKAAPPPEPEPARPPASALGHVEAGVDFLKGKLIELADGQTPKPEEDEEQVAAAAAADELDYIPSLEQVIKERDVLALRAASLQEDKFKLEEKVAYFEESTRAMTDDLYRKKRLLQAFCVRDKRDAMALLDDDVELPQKERASDQKLSLGNVAKGFAGAAAGAAKGMAAIGRKVDPKEKRSLAELQDKMVAMETVLEETVLNNVALQNELVAKSTELEGLVARVAELESA